MDSLCLDLCENIPKPLYKQEIHNACDLLHVNQIPESNNIKHQLSTILQCGSINVPDCKKVCKQSETFLKRTDPQQLVDFFCASEALVQSEKKIMIDLCRTLNTPFFDSVCPYVTDMDKSKQKCEEYSHMAISQLDIGH